MSTGTEVAVRSGFDLTRAPNEQWNEEMVKMVAHQLFRGEEVTKGELYYCLSIADGLGLNPLIGEIYFIPSKGRDGKGPTRQPYIGRTGLVKKAKERDYYYEADTVRENDKFRMARKRDGTVEVTHSYGSAERGKIMGAYAFLHDETGQRKPAFFYAEWDQYVPTFDQQWKHDASPWGNQSSAMIEKCAMIGAGRKRLDLGHVLMDGEVARFDQQRSLGPGGEPVEEQAPFDFDALPAPAEITGRLRSAVETLRAVDPTAWPAAKLEMVLVGKDADALHSIMLQIETEAERVVSQGAGGAESRSEEGAGDSLSEPEPPGESVIDAQVVEEESLEALRAQEAFLVDRLNEPDLSEDAVAELGRELDRVRLTIQAGEDPGQDRMPL